MSPSSESAQSVRRPPTWALAVLAVTLLLIGTLAVGAAVPGEPPGSPAAYQQPTSGFSGTIDADEADASVLGTDANATAGWSVASAGDVNDDGIDDLLVGAPRTNVTGIGNESGAAYLLFGPVESDGLDLSEADVTLAGEGANDWAGWSVAGAGDVDGDGVDDVLVGAPLNDANGDQAGAVYVVHGGSWLPESMNLADANATLYGGDDDRAGWSVSNVSNVSSGSGDATGQPGVLVGAPTDNEGGEDAGAAFLVGASSIGRRTLLEVDADAKFVGENESDNAGNAVSWAGDVDADGTDDLLVGARGNDGSGNDSGAAYLVSADVDGTVSLADANVTMHGAGPFDEAGRAVSGAGDVNDDGVPDVLVGAPFNDSAATDAGAAYVVYGSDSLPATIDFSEADVTVTGGGEGDFAGWSVAAAGSGDVTCDRVDDVLVGAPWNDTRGSRAGAAYLISGGESLPETVNPSDATARFVGGAAGDRFGFSLGSAGDQNDDGVDDVLIGAPYNDSAGEDAGAAYVFVGDCPVPPERTRTPTATPKPTPTPTPTPTRTPAETQTETPTPTPTPTETPTPTPTPTETPTPTPTPTETPTGTPTETPAETPTETPAETPTETQAETTAGTPTETPTATPTESPADGVSPDLLSVTFLGCGDVTLSGPDDLFPTEVRLATYSPIADDVSVGPPIELDEDQLPGSPGGRLIGILTDDGNFTNPNFDPASASCADASAGNPASGQPGDPLVVFGSIGGG